jgi:azurin
MDRVDKENLLFSIGIVLLCVVIAALSGCAASGGAIGNAQYQYSHNADGCSITVNSARELQSPDIQITPECQVTVTARKTGTDATYMGIISNLAAAVKP